MVPRAFIAGKNKRIEGMEFMLVEIVGKRYEERLITTSLKVAEHFEKEHRHVLDAIRNLAAENSAASFFTLTTYKNRGKVYPMYEMDRERGDAEPLFLLIKTYYFKADIFTESIRLIESVSNTLITNQSRIPLFSRVFIHECLRIS